MNADLTHWRCRCGWENPEAHLHCEGCRKRRWAQLDVSQPDAYLLLDAIQGGVYGVRIQ